MSAPVKATVTPEDTETAHELNNDTGHYTCPVRGPHIPECAAIAQAIANAREAGRREAFRDALGLLQERADHFAQRARYGSGDEARDAAARRANEWHEAARQIAAARDRALAEYGKAQGTGEGAA